MWKSPELLLVVLSLQSATQSMVLKVSTCVQRGAVCHAMATQLTCILLHCFSALLTSSSTLVIIAHRPSTCHPFSSVHVHRYRHCHCNASTDMHSHLECQFSVHIRLGIMQCHSLLLRIGGQV